MKTEKYGANLIKKFFYPNENKKNKNNRLDENHPANKVVDARIKSYDFDLDYISSIYCDYTMITTLEHFLNTKESLAKDIGISVEELEGGLKGNIKNEKIRTKIEEFFAKQADRLDDIVYYRSKRHGKLMNIDEDYIDNPLD